MKEIISACFAILLCVAVSFGHSGKHEGGAKFTKHFNDTLFAVSDKGQVSIEVLLDEKEHKIGKDMIGVVIHDIHDEDVEDANLIITVTGISEPLKVKEKGGGLYLAPSISLPKEGTWRLGISVKKKKIEDGAVFNFPEVLQKKMLSGKYDAGSLKAVK